MCMEMPRLSRHGRSEQKETKESKETKVVASTGPRPNGRGNNGQGAGSEPTAASLPTLFATLTLIRIAPNFTA
jgi:hypothetical protein